MLLYIARGQRGEAGEEKGERREEATKFTTVWSSLQEGESPNEATGKKCSYKRLRKVLEVLESC